MSNFVFDIAKGRVAEFANRVANNDPANSALIVVAIDRNGDSDATMKTRADLLSLTGGLTNEVTNGNYVRKTLTDSSSPVSIPSPSADTVGHTMTLDFGDLTWTAVAAGTAWTDLVICYDSDTTSGNDSNVIPLTCHAFAVTPDTSDITALVTNWFIAS